MALTFSFGGSSGQSYDDLKRRRAFAETMQLRGAQGQPKNAIEGLNSAAQSILGALMSKKLGQQEDAGRAAYNASFGELFSGAPQGQPSPVMAGPVPSAPTTIGDQTMAALGKPSNNFKPGDKDSFVSAMMPHAIEASKATGVDPRLIVAQAAQETGWGAHAPGNNFFGIKSHGQGGGNTMATTEYVNGQPVTVNDSFRGYDSMRDSAQGYAKFLLENPRYKPMLEADGLDAQVAALGASGYATDPNYATSVGNIANGIDPRLVEAMGSPYATDAQRSVLGMLLQQKFAQMQPPDPLDALALEKAQWEVDHLGDNPANIPAGFQSLDMQAQAAGYAPGTPEYQDFMRNGGGSGTPAAFTALDMQAQAAGFIPGTPEYQDFMATRGAGLAAGATERAKAEAGMEIAAPADIVVADRTLEYIDEVRNHPGRGAGTGATSVFNFIPGTSGRDFQNRVDQLKSGAFLSAIDELRGMGSLSNAEGQTATAAITRMDTATSEGEFNAALDDYERIVMLGRDRAQKRIPAPTDTPAAPTGEGNAKKKTINGYTIEEQP